MEIKHDPVVMTGEDTDEGREQSDVLGGGVSSDGRRSLRKVWFKIRKRKLNEP